MMRGKELPAMPMSGAMVTPMIELKRVNAPSFSGSVSGVYGMVCTKIDDPIVPTKNRARD